MKKSSPEPSSEMNQAVRTMFSLPPADVKRIVDSKPGNRRGESGLDKAAQEFLKRRGKARK